MSADDGQPELTAWTPSVDHRGGARYRGGRREPAVEPSSLHIEPLGLEARMRAVWVADTPKWALVIGHLAPTILGFGLASIVVILWLLGGLLLPSTFDGWARLALAAVTWSVYTTPSGDDLLGWREVVQ